jgi:hypothetical protein
MSEVEPSTLDCPFFSVKQAIRAISHRRFNSRRLRLGLGPRLPAQFRTSAIRARPRPATSETTFKILLKNLKAFLMI